MAKKNPNLNRGISVSIRKKANVRISLPCTRLERKLLELLEKAKVRSTEYIFIIQDTGKSEPSLQKPIGIKILPDTTLGFRVTITLKDGEFFIGTLRAPVKCAGDGLQTELNRAALEINTTGWYETKPEKTAPAAKSAKIEATGSLKIQRDIIELLKSIAIEVGGLERDISRLQQKLDEMLKTKQGLESQLEILKSMKQM